MGTGPITVTPDSVVQILQTYRGPVTITNTGANTVYLDDTSSVSKFAYDKALTPGTTISWADNTNCWAIADPLGPTTLDLSFKVTNFGSAAVGGSGSQASTVLYTGPLSGITNIAQAISVRGFQSIKVFCATPAATNAGPNLAQQVVWIGDTSAPAIIYVDEIYLQPSEAIYYWHMVLDVKAPAFYLTVVGAPYASEPTVSVIGFATKQPQICFDYDNSLRVPGRYPDWSVIFGPLPAAAQVNVPLPLWSGTIQVETYWAFNVAPATMPFAILGDRLLSGALNTVGGLVMVPTATPTLAAQARGVWTINGGRRPRVISIYPGTGYGNFTARLGVSFYGAETL